MCSKFFLTIALTFYLKNKVTYSKTCCNLYKNSTQYTTIFKYLNEFQTIFEFPNIVQDSMTCNSTQTISDFIKNRQNNFRLIEISK